MKNTCCSVAFKKIVTQCITSKLVEGKKLNNKTKKNLKKAFKKKKEKIRPNYMNKPFPWRMERQQGTKPDTLCVNAILNFPLNNCDSINCFK